MMSSYILATKKSQSQMFNPNGHRVPVTEFFVNKNYVMGICTPEKNGYTSVQIGTGSYKRNLKPVLGKAKKNGITEDINVIKEFRPDAFLKNTEYSVSEEEKKITINETTYTVGQPLHLEDLFKEGDIVDISGKTKGKGFQGVMKRHGFRGGPRTHGQSDRERAPGSMGSGTTLGRIFKGKKLAGRMGGVQRTVKGLEVLRVDNDSIVVKGLVPGNTSELVQIKKTSRSY